jgi:hypothetical protein
MLCVCVQLVNVMNTEPRVKIVMHSASANVVVILAALRAIAVLLAFTGSPTVCVSGSA